MGPHPPAGKESALTETSEHSRAIAALISRKRFTGVDLQVELREAPAGRPAGVDWPAPAPAAILWQAERPLAVLAGDLLALARASAGSLREPLRASARSAGLEVTQVRESQLWWLMPRPPHGSPHGPPDGDSC